MDKREKTDWRWSRLCFLLLLLAGLPAVGHAGLYYGFDGITNNNPTDVAIGESQLSVEVSGYGSNQVLFTFRNRGPAASSICDIYFDDGSLLYQVIELCEGLGVDFSVGATPRELPGAKNVVPEFITTKNLLTDSNPPAQPNGVNPGESLGILFSLKSGKTLENVYADLESQELRIGIHVQGFLSGGSESFINGEKVPVPGAVVLGLLGLSAAGLKLRRFS